MSGNSESLHRREKKSDKVQCENNVPVVAVLNEPRIPDDNSQASGDRLQTPKCQNIKRPVSRISPIQCPKACAGSRLHDPVMLSNLCRANWKTPHCCCLHHRPFRAGCVAVQIKITVRSMLFLTPAILSLLHPINTASRPLHVSSETCAGVATCEALSLIPKKLFCGQPKDQRRHDFQGQWPPNWLGWLGAGMHVHQKSPLDTYRFQLGGFLGKIENQQTSLALNVSGVT